MKTIASILLLGCAVAACACDASGGSPYLTPALSLPLGRAGEAETFAGARRDGARGLLIVQDCSEGETMKTSALWKTLTRTQRRAWSAWAKSNKVLLDDGSLRFVSGRKAMTMVVRNRTVAGEATNPSVVPAAFAWLNGPLSLRDAGPFTENLGFVGFRAEQNLAGGTRFFVWATPPVDGGVVNPHAQLRFVTCITSDGTVVNDLVPITTEYLAVNGSWDGPGVEGAWPVDTFIWFRVHQYANGQLGPGVMLKGRIVVEL